MAHTYTLDEITELLKCMNDYQYFAKTYFQIDLPIINSESILTHKQAQVYVLWATLFQRDKTTIALTKNHVRDKEYISKIREMLFSVHDWMRPQLIKGTSTNLHFENGCKIFSMSGRNAGKGFTISILHVTADTDLDTRNNLIPCVHATRGLIIQS